MAARARLTRPRQIDIDDGFLNLIDDNGNEKNDVKMPDGEAGEKITKLFVTEEKETSKFFLSRVGGSCPPAPYVPRLTERVPDVTVQTAMGEEAAIDAKEAPK